MRQIALRKKGQLLEGLIKGRVWYWVYKSVMAGFQESRL